jgi:hypothetical protein
MKTCTFCRSLILFGGKTDSTGHYCNDKCRQRGTIVAMSKTIPDSTVQEHLWATIVRMGLAHEAIAERAKVGVQAA